jgi:hypothetical protein
MEFELLGEQDGDGDGYPACGDCNDANASMNVGNSCSIAN